MAFHCRPARCPFALVLLVLLLPVGARAQAPAASSTTFDMPRDQLPARALAGVTFGEVQLRDLPSSGTIWSLVETADSLTIVDRIENGGLYLGEPKLFGSFGSSWTQASYVMDGLDLTDPDRTGTPLAYPGASTVQAVQVVSSLGPVDLAGAGPTILLTPRAPARQWHGGLEASYLSHQLQAKGGSAAVPAIAEFGSGGEGGILFSGPTAPGAGVLLSFRRAQSRRFERGDPTELDSRVTSVFANATFQPDADSHVRLVASVDAASHPFAGRLRFADRSVEARDTFWHVHGLWERATAGGASWSVAAGYNRGVLGAPDEEETPTIGVIERMLDGPVPETMVPAGGLRERWNGRVTLRPLGRRQASRHEPEIGLSISRTTSRTDATARAVIGELIDGIPARAWDYSYGGDSMQGHATELAAWASDQVALGSRVILDAGARFDATRADARDNPTGISWQAILPRASARFLLSKGGGAAFSAGWAMRRHRLPLGYLAYGDTSAPSALVYRWRDANGDRRLTLPERSTLVAFQGPGPGGRDASRIDPDLAAPLTDEVTLGLDARMGRRWAFRLVAVERHQRRLVASVNEGVTVADYIAHDVWDNGNDFLNPIDDRYLTIYDRRPASFGRDSYVLTNPDGHHGNQVGIDLAFERQFDGRWYMLFAASAQRSDGYSGNRGFHVNENDNGVVGELFENPNALSYVRGRLFLERGYIIKWSGGFVTSNGIHFGAIARYQDGQHFARMVVADGLAQGAELVQAYTRGHSRFTFSFTLDARLEKAFRAGGHTFALVAEAFNLLNNKLEVEEDPVVTRAFRATTAVQPPRAIRFGLRLGF